MSFAPPTGSLADPDGSSAPVAAVQWLQGTLLGTAATIVAVICVATIGLMMLSGRVSFRRAASVILGCFIVFGASSIAAGFRSLAGGGGAGPADPEPALAAPSYPPPTLPPPPAAPRDLDPYAGAAVPTR